MPGPGPESTPSPEGGPPDPDQPQVQGGPGGPRFTWVPGSELDGHELSGPVPPEALPGAKPEGAIPAVLDWQALLEALAASGMLDGNLEDQDAEMAEELEAEDNGRMGPSMDPGQVAALAVDHMEPGPALAGWLNVAAGAAAALDENGLTGVAVAARRQAAHANSVELAAVAQITSRAAAADRRIGVNKDGRPARVGRDAIGQVQMALRLSHDGAGAWADLAVTLAWRLLRTNAALKDGWIDLDRAEIIARATSVLGEDAAREVEDKVLPEAGWRTTAWLRKRVHDLVIDADPDGAEDRRQKAEQHADVRLFANDDQTATMMADKLPQIESAAGFARINALARARKAAGLPGSLGLHRAHVLLGLILGTLPPIPPAESAPPDQPSPPSDDPDPRDSDSGPADCDPRHPGGAGNGSPGPVGGGHSDDPDGANGGPRDESAAPQDEPPMPRDEDAPADDGLDETDGGIDPDHAVDPWEADDDLAGTGSAPVWPALGPVPPALVRDVPTDGKPPAGGLLDVTLPWLTLAGLAERPGILGRIGAITPAQARRLAHAACSNPTAQWRVIVTNPAGHAIAVARIRRRTCHGPPRAGPVGRITLTISQDTIASRKQPGTSGAPARAGPAAGILAAALRTAGRALEYALAQAEADAAAGGCAHTAQSPAYRPPTRLREYVIARDFTCRNPVCGQPAGRGDLDHTIPWQDGGRTCRCNIGGACRRDHQLKQHPRWKLRQVKPGWFEWTAPSGRTYTSSPATYIT
jgi:hypothetical protein